MKSPEFAFTGPMPAQGYVGFVNIHECDGGVKFTVRTEGDAVVASFVIPKAEAVALLGKALIGLGGPLQHDFWMPGDPACPGDIKAGNGELHTLRCKRCGRDNPREKICVS